MNHAAGKGLVSRMQRTPTAHDREQTTWLKSRRDLNRCFAEKDGRMARKHLKWPSAWLVAPRCAPKPQWICSHPCWSACLRSSDSPRCWWGQAVGTPVRCWGSARCRQLRSFLQNWTHTKVGPGDPNLGYLPQRNRSWGLGKTVPRC